MHLLFEHLDMHIPVFSSFPFMKVAAKVLNDLNPMCLTGVGLGRLRVHHQPHSSSCLCSAAHAALQ